jgi:8-oxo-dGTP pyrophosphatase MutT (NUDIX family)
VKTDLTVAGYIINNGKVLLIHHRKLNLWLPVGGHIDKDETPDEALLREIKEEVGIDAEIIGKSPVPLIGNAKKNLALPFHTNLHSVGDHDHYCLFYVCSPLSQKVELKLDEVKSAEWFSKEELQQERVPLDVRHIALHAFEIYERR